MSYIERDVALNAIQNLPSVCGCSAIDRDEAENAIMTLPAADVVEVVRCKDCKHRHEPTRCALWYGMLGDTEYFLERGEDFYCPWGERRERTNK